MKSEKEKIFSKGERSKGEQEEWREGRKMDRKERKGRKIGGNKGKDNDTIG